MSDSEQHLWETDETGPLDTAGYPMKDQYQGPSLSGPMPQISGIGGSTVGVDKAPGGVGFNAPVHVPERPQKPQAVPTKSTMTPEQLMAWASAQEQDLRFQTAEAAFGGQSAVEPALERSMNGTPPVWLEQYMNRTPTSGKIVLDPSGQQRYMQEYNKGRSETENLRQLKSKL